MKPPQPTGDSGFHLLTLMIVLLVALGILGLFLIDPSARRSCGPRVRSIAALHKIGLAIRSYREDHNGILPARFSDLVPGYVSITELKAFYPDAGYQARFRRRPPDWMTNPSLIDTYSVFTYLGANFQGKHGMLAYERPGVWNTNSSSWMSSRVAVLFEDYRVELTPSSYLLKHGVTTD